MLKTATKWLSWLCVFVTLLFAFCAVSAILNWFDRDIADILTRYSAYTIFLIGAALIGCILFDQADDD